MHSGNFGPKTHLEQYAKRGCWNKATRTWQGDACIPIDKRIPGLRVQFIQTIARENYIWHLYAIFRDFVGTPPKVLHHRGGGTRDYQCIRFQT